MPRIGEVRATPKADVLDPFWQTVDGETVRLYRGHVIDVLRRFPPKSVQTIVTSPPYWGLRDYQADKRFELGSEKVPDCLGWARGVNCAEHDWDNGCHVCRMVLVLRESRRVLRDDGTLWLNYGDSYNQYKANSGRGKGLNRTSDEAGAWPEFSEGLSVKGLPCGNLVGIPWRVALALQADGWVLRQDIVWHKPSPMPESVTNRCTKAHEYMFLFTKKGSGYYCDMEAIKESGTGNGQPCGQKNDDSRNDGDTVGTVRGDGATRNKRSVWTVASQGYPGTHFATFPPKLIEPCILAGTSEKGACAKCGAPWKRVVEERKLTRERPNEYVKRKPFGEGLLPKDEEMLESDTGYDGHRTRVGLRAMNTCSNSVAGVEVETVGWVPTCTCFGKFVRSRVVLNGRERNNHPVGGNKYTDPSITEVRPQNGPATEDREVTRTEYVSDLPLDEHPIRPCVVLDLFIGSGTTCVVSLEHGRSSIGIDLSEDYLRFNAIPRIEGFMLDVPYLRALLPVREITRRGHALGTPKPE